ncbi:MAG: hypothetical protein ACOC9N_01075 [Gemmatimonadota bacterium]
MRTTQVRIAALFLALAAGVAACGDDEMDDTTGPDGPYTLTFQGDATFNGPHGGQDVYVAVVDAGDGSVVASDQSTVSDSDDPAFSFTFDDVLEADAAYEVHYWIDSNFNGGTSGECEDIDTDHQWAVDLGTVDDDVTRTEDHDANTRSDVCSTFD